MNANAEYKYDFLVFIGRFQPFHLGHAQVIDEALKIAKQVVVLVGSSDSAINKNNPFTYQQREEMISSNYPSDGRVLVRGLRDSISESNSEWVGNILTVVEDIFGNDFRKHAKFGFIGHYKDSSSSYLDLFKGDLVEIDMNININATDIRNLIFQVPRLVENKFKNIFEVEDAKTFSKTIRKAARLSAPECERYVREGKMDAHAQLNQMKKATKKLVPESTINFLESYIDSDDYGHMFLEVAILALEKRMWSYAPYPPIFTTADCPLFFGGKVLLIRRNGYPGHGQWAIPGGFLEADEYSRECAIREMKEEVGIAINNQNSSYIESFMMESPRRSTRGRTISLVHPFRWHADNAPEINIDPNEVKEYKWVYVNNLRRDEMFEDHYAIALKSAKILNIN